MRLGLISDTHGLLRPEALDALRGVDAILHAGDVGHPDVLSGLAAIAPVHAVRGNVDEPEAVRRSRRRNAPDPDWARALPARLDLSFGGVPVVVLHVVDAVGEAPPPGSVVVSGHSHVPDITRRAGVLRVNPGSAGPRRFRLPVTCALLDLGGADPEAYLVTLV
jgi:putative phosphoesterase